MNLILDLAMAMAMLGLPLLVLSWLLFLPLFASGELDRSEDRKGMQARLKESHKKRRKAHYLHNKWTWFGGGFYGLAGLWTFAVIEISQFIGFLRDYANWPALLADGWVSFLLAALMDQLANMLQALIWFAWWPGESLILWVLVAYLGYWLGVELARRGVPLPLPQRFHGPTP